MKMPIRKIGLIVWNERRLRVLALLIVLCLVAGAVLGLMGRSRHGEEQKVLADLQLNMQTYDSLQKLATEEGKRAVQKGFFGKKAFASFEDVIPFIAYLEKLLSPIDPEAQITIKSPEGQIYLDHVADYSVHFKLGEGGKDLLLKALEQLHESRFIVKTMSFNMVYMPSAEGGEGRFGEMMMTLRLYLK